MARRPLDPLTLGRAKVLAAAALFSTGGAAIKATGFGSWQVAALRSGFAAAAILLLVPGARRGWTPRLLVVALAYAATLVLFVTANKLTTSANAIFLQSTAPLYVLLLGPLLLKEPIGRRDLAFMAALAAGLALFFVGSEERYETAPDPVLGNVLAAASGATWALTVASLRAFAKREASGGASAMAVPALGNLVAFVVCLPFAWPLEAGRPVDWVLVTFLGAFQIGLAYLCLTGGVRVVSALEGSLLLLLEPVLNPVWAWLAHGEKPGPWAIGGALLILGATAVHAVLAPRRPAPPEVTA